MAESGGKMPEIEARGVHGTFYTLKASTLPQSKPVWPSGKALGWYAEGYWLDSAQLSLLFKKGCGLWTLSSDFVLHN